MNMEIKLENNAAKERAPEERGQGRGPEGKRGLLWIVLLLAVAGIAVSVELTRIHVSTHTDPEFHSICALSEEVNCETVALSPYSVFLGLPVSVWGIIGYLFLAGLAISGIPKRRLHDTWPCGGLLALSVFFFTGSAVLAYISFFRIDSVCLFCAASYVINTVLLILSIAAVARRRLHPLKAVAADVGAMLRRPLLLAGVVLALAAAVGGTVLGVAPYWRGVGWDDLPELPSGVDEHGHHWIGAKKPEVTIVEFSDYECPHCRKAHRTTRALAARYPDKIRLYHRHLPLDSACHPRMKRMFHQFACHFAKAVECAGAEGKFWEMNDALFSIQNKIKSKDVDVNLLAVQIGLDRSAFKQCMASDEPMAAVKEDLDAAMEMGLRGTPTYLVNGRKYMGRIPDAVIAELLGDPAP